MLRHGLLFVLLVLLSVQSQADVSQDLLFIKLPLSVWQNLKQKNQESMILINKLQDNYKQRSLQLQNLKNEILISQNITTNLKNQMKTMEESFLNLQGSTNQLVKQAINIKLENELMKKTMGIIIPVLSVSLLLSVV